MTAYILTCNTVSYNNNSKVVYPRILGIYGSIEKAIDARKLYKLIGKSKTVKGRKLIEEELDGVFSINEIQFDEYGLSYFNYTLDI